MHGGIGADLTALKKFYSIGIGKFFDTQIAANDKGYGMNLSLEALGVRVV